MIQDTYWDILFDIVQADEKYSHFIVAKALQIIPDFIERKPQDYITSELINVLISLTDKEEDIAKKALEVIGLITPYIIEKGDDALLAIITETAQVQAFPEGLTVQTFSEIVAHAMHKRVTPMHTAIYKDTLSVAFVALMEATVSDADEVYVYFENIKNIDDTLLHRLNAVKGVTVVTQQIENNGYAYAENFIKAIQLLDVDSTSDVRVIAPYEILHNVFNGFDTKTQRPEFLFSAGHVAVDVMQREEHEMILFPFVIQPADAFMPALVEVKREDNGIACFYQLADSITTATSLYRQQLLISIRDAVERVARERTIRIAA